MVGDAGEAAQGVVTEAAAQAFGQGRPVQAFAAHRLEQVAMARPERRQVVGQQRQRTDFRWNFRAFQAAAAELIQRVGFALHAGQADGQPGQRAVFVFQMQLEALHAAVAHVQIQGQFAHQPAQRKKQRLPVFHRPVQLYAPGKTVRRLVQGQRFHRLATQHVEPVHLFRSYATAQFHSRQGEDVAQLAETHAMQLRDRGRGQAAHGQRCLVQRLQHGAALTQRNLFMAQGEYPRGRRDRRHAQAIGAETQRLQFLLQLPQQGGPAFEQGQAGTDFQPHGVGFGPADLAAEAIGPGGQ